MNSPIKQLLIDAHAKGWIPASPSSEKPEGNRIYWVISAYGIDEFIWDNETEDITYFQAGVFYNESDAEAAYNYLYEGIKHKKPTPTMIYNGFEIPDTALSYDDVQILGDSKVFKDFFIASIERECCVVKMSSTATRKLPSFLFDRELVFALEHHAKAKCFAMLGHEYNWRENEGEQDG